MELTEKILMEILFKSNNKEELSLNLKEIGFTDDEFEMYYSMLFINSYHFIEEKEHCEKIKVYEEKLPTYRSEFLTEFTAIIKDYVVKDFSDYVISDECIIEFLNSMLHPLTINYFGYLCQERRSLTIFVDSNNDLGLCDIKLSDKTRKYKSYDLRELLEKNNYSDKFIKPGRR